MPHAIPSTAVLDALKAALGPGGWTQDPEVIAPSLTEWRNRWTGHTPILLTPRSTEETAKAIAICAQSGVAVTPQGGGTGLVGGQIPFGEVLLSLKKIRAVRDVTPLDDAMTVEAGLTLLEAQQAAAATQAAAQVEIDVGGHGPQVLMCNPSRTGTARSKSRNPHAATGAARRRRTSPGIETPARNPIRADAFSRQLGF